MPPSLVLPSHPLRTPDLVPHPFEIERQAQSTLKGHRSLLLWFTGMSGAGKSCIANRVQAGLHAIGNTGLAGARHPGEPQQQ